LIGGNEQLIFPCRASSHPGGIIAFGRKADAEDLLRRALAVAAEQSARMWELRAAMSLARLLRDSGRSSEAERCLYLSATHSQRGSSSLICGNVGLWHRNWMRSLPEPALRVKADSRMLPWRGLMDRHPIRSTGGRTPSSSASRISFRKRFSASPPPERVSAHASRPVTEMQRLSTRARALSAAKSDERRGTHPGRL
jgi:hypothetical protein